MYYKEGQEIKNRVSILELKIEKLILVVQAFLPEDEKIIFDY